MADIIVLNEITELLNNVNSELSTDISSVKSVVDTISTNVNTANTNINAIKTNTAANNTASATGTLSQKMTYIMNNVGKTYIPSNTVIKTVSTSNSLVHESNISNTKFYGNKYNYYCGFNGNYRFSITASVDDVIYKNKYGSAYCGLLITISRSAQTIEYMIEICNSAITSSVSAKTVTKNVWLEAGDYVSICLYAYGDGGYAGACVTTYNLGFTINSTSIIICGTQKTISTSDVFY